MCKEKSYFKSKSERILAAALNDGAQASSTIELVRNDGQPVAVGITSNLTAAEKSSTFITISQGDYKLTQRISLLVLDITETRLAYPAEHLDQDANGSRLDVTLSNESGGNLAATAKIDLHLFFDKPMAC